MSVATGSSHHGRHDITSPVAKMYIGVRATNARIYHEEADPFLESLRRGDAVFMRLNLLVLPYVPSSVVHIAL